MIFRFLTCKKYVSNYIFLYVLIASKLDINFYIVAGYYFAGCSITWLKNVIEDQVQTRSYMLVSKWLACRKKGKGRQHEKLFPYRSHTRKAFAQVKIKLRRTKIRMLEFFLAFFFFFPSFFLSSRDNIRKYCYSMKRIEPNQRKIL